MNGVEQLAAGLPEKLKDARLTAERARDTTSRFVRNNTGACLIGAFIVGYAFAKVARYA